MATLGIMGGTFDPIHNAHLAIARMARDMLEGIPVVFLPDADPPHKAELTPAAQRLRMVELAVEGREGFCASDLEIKRGGVTYTVDTLKQLRALRPADDFCYIVGGDTLLLLESWRSFPEVARLLRLVVAVPRVGGDLAKLRAQAERLRSDYGLRVRIAAGEGPAISSTDVRYAVARHLSIAELVPPAVAAYIESEGLYRDPMLDRLHATLSPKRYRHTLGVERAAMELAKRFGADEEKARLAALLHDCAKGLPPNDMRRWIARERLPVAADELSADQLLHAPAGAILARREYGIEDAEILNAIRYHTIGRAGMSTLEKVVYLADAIEEYREPYPGLAELRDMAQNDLDGAVLASRNQSRAHARSKGYVMLKEDW